MFVADEERAETVGVAVSLHAFLGAVQVELLSTLYRLGTSNDWSAEGCRSIQHWVALHFGVAARTARLWLDAAEVLAAWPVLADALAQGRVTLDQVIPLGVLMTADPDHDWIGQANVTSVAQYETLARAAKDRVPPEPVTKSVLSIQPDRTRTGWNVRGTLTSSDGEIVLNALEALTKQLVPEIDESGATTYMSRDEQLAVALVELASGATPGTVAEISIHVTADALGSACVLVARCRVVVWS
jgi:hypothetical protein